MKTDVDKLKKLRESMNMSQTDFANKFDIPFQTYTQWESGRRQPPEYVVKMIEKVCRQESMIDNLKGQNKNSSYFNSAAKMMLTELGCPVYVVCKPTIVVATDEVGDEKYYLTVGQIAKQDTGFLTYWLNSKYDPEYREYIDGEFDKCNTDDDFIKLCHDEYAKNHKKWHNRYQSIVTGLRSLRDECQQFAEWARNTRVNHLQSFYDENKLKCVVSYKRRYDLILKDSDIERAKEIFDKRLSPMYFDPWRMMVIEKYLAHFEGPEYELKDILDEDTIRTTVDKDNDLKACLPSLYVLVESFDELCDYLGSVPVIEQKDN